MSYLIRCVLAKPRLILDEMCRLYGKFASYLRRVLCKTCLIFPCINGPTKFHSQRCPSLRKLTVYIMYLLELGPSDNTEVSKDMKYPLLDTAENKINYGVQNTLNITNTSAKKPTDKVIEMIPVWNFHFAVKPVVALRNVCCFLRQSNLEFQYLVSCRGTVASLHEI